MTKYSEIEIETANNLLRDGYKWLVRTTYGNVVAFSCRLCKNEGYWVWPNYGESEVVSGKFTPLFQSIRWEDDEPTSIESIVHPQILDDAEREYLKTVLKPFRGAVKYIKKIAGYDKEHLFIAFYCNGAFDFPNFDAGTMYTGMELNKEYKLYELGITYEVRHETD